MKAFSWGEEESLPTQNMLRFDLVHPKKESPGYQRSAEDPAPFVKVDYTKDGSLGLLWLDAADVVIHHYVEMIAHDRGRCATLLRPCDVGDRSMEWAVKMLQHA